MSSVGSAVVARAEVPGTLISDYVLRKPEGARELILILHGYQLSGKIVYDKIAPFCPPDAVILAPNAPFPLPERKADGSYRVGFSWYFYNPGDGGSYFIDMKIGLELISGLIGKLGLGDLPVRVIGFSQGGYIAPLAALGFPRAKQVVGIAAEYLPDEMGERSTQLGIAGPPSFRVDSINGGKDDIVLIQDARTAHEAMLARGARGKFIELADEGHRLSPAVLAALQTLLSETA